MQKNLRETAESSAIFKVGYKESMVFREEFFTLFFSFLWLIGAVTVR